MDNKISKWMINCVLNKSIKDIERRLAYNKQRYENLSNRFPAKKELGHANARDEKYLKAYGLVSQLFNEDKIVFKYFLNEEYANVQIESISLPTSDNEKELHTLAESIFPLTIHVSQ